MRYAKRLRTEARDQLSELVAELVRLSRHYHESAVAVRAVMQLTAHSHSISRL
jgi:hypothetical protein